MDQKQLEVPLRADEQYPLKTQDYKPRPSEDFSDAETEQTGQFNEALDQAEQTLKVYPERYLMAFLYSMMGLAVSMEQSMYSAQGAALTNVYNVSTIEVQANTLIHMLLHFPMSFPANYIVDKFGILIGLWIAGFFLILGSCIRLLINDVGFWISLIGAVCIGIANPFIVNSLNKVSSNWFYPSQRPGVTSFLSFFSTVTGLAGIILPSIWFGSYKCDENCTDSEKQKGKDLMFSLTYVLAIIEAVLVIPCVIFFRNKPPTPPSFVDDVEREDFKIAIKYLATDKVYMFLGIIFAVYYGSFQNIATLLSFIIEPFFGQKSVYVGVLSGLPIMSGIVGCIVSSKFLSKTQKYKRTIVICMIGSFVSLVLFSVLLYTKQFWLICIPSLVLGFCIIPMIPTTTEWACELFYPIGEPTVTGFIWAMAHIYGGLTGIGYAALLNDEGGKNAKSNATQKGHVMIFAAVVSIQFAGAFFLNFFVKGPLKRLQAEKERAVQQAEITTLRGSNS